MTPAQSPAVCALLGQQFSSPVPASCPRVVEEFEAGEAPPSESDLLQYQ
jgi:hypothetical protein